MIDVCEAALQGYEQQREQWHGDHHAWLEDLKRWQACEQRVVGIIFELEAALPAHRNRLDRFRKMVIEHERLLEVYARGFAQTRADVLDEQCDSALETLRAASASRCNGCEPPCYDALLAMHTLAEVRHAEMSLEQVHLKAEHDASREQLRELANGLLACLDSPGSTE
ncbi:MAG: phosphoenolpyruvate synthase [Zetaproteobacteria bacterium CG12_big_fil_rev_8_21_14_0_65_54_13]|nr:MAG: phosphoenolpyruvate synthase [Zetaproteobacteria bacterium CG12_big_fil_rev_8_21_14_0_65_54_13]PIX54745.1 MAG: phosphoenolpyruvate synthase [Zetaproteobacteria bacterium CG_4_10_14_3_um_filter_54_28]PJA30229.1 MAG: phosphoenolpyruvate synthase [Zetaproteobacteria bacterium CG_4_9_14_3_um_filter_54_145]